MTENSGPNAPVRERAEMTEAEAIAAIRDPNLRGCFVLAVEARESGDQWKVTSFARVLMGSRRYWEQPSLMVPDAG